MTIRITIWIQGLFSRFVTIGRYGKRYQPTALRDAAVRRHCSDVHHYVTGPQQTATTDVHWRRYALSQCLQLHIYVGEFDIMNDAV